MIVRTVRWREPTVGARKQGPPLRAGYEAEWAEVNREEQQQMRAENMTLTPSQRLTVGQRLSEQAVSLLVASIRAGHAPKRALLS
jgi:hypothetical protein